MPDLTTAFAEAADALGIGATSIVEKDYFEPGGREFESLRARHQYLCASSSYRIMRSLAFVKHCENIPEFPEMCAGSVEVDDACLGGILNL